MYFDVFGHHLTCSVMKRKHCEVPCMRTVAIHIKPILYQKPIHIVQFSSYIYIFHNSQQTEILARKKF